MSFDFDRNKFLRCRLLYVCKSITYARLSPEHVNRPDVKTTPIMWPPCSRAWWTLYGYTLQVSSQSDHVSRRRSIYTNKKTGSKRRESNGEAGFQKGDELWRDWRPKIQSLPVKMSYPSLDNLIILRYIMWSYCISPHLNNQRGSWTVILSDFRPKSDQFRTKMSVFSWEDSIFVAIFWYLPPNFINFFL